uniref:Uncharacterized protein n=1 Tax=Anopheles farauti TaxID=69004 RepID=A0A182Q7T1_9DIPT
MFSLVSPQTQPASPWRFQTDEIVNPRTRLGHQTNGSMVQSYESFINENNNIQESPRSKQAYITERRKSNAQQTAISEEPGTDLVSEQDLREIEQMYNALKATSEMSEKLITAMRKCKSKAATPQQLKDRHRYKANMQQACLKLKQWYDRSMQSFTHSMRIIGNIQRAAACPSPLSHEQQRVVEKFNLSTDRFRSMIDDMQSVINDSDLENRPPVPAVSSGIVKAKSTIDDAAKDVLILPERGANAHRNPLMPLNFVPLPQRDSPLMSPLAKDFTSTVIVKTPLAAKSLRRGELQYDLENESFITNREIHQRGDANGDSASVLEILDETAGNASKVDKINPTAEVATSGMQNNNKNGSKEDYFGFDDDDNDDDDNEAIENSIPQITLPMPQDISYDTLQRRLKNMNTLLPRRPIFRQQQPAPNTRSSGPTRFPPVKPPRVISSPTKRPRTLREFVASTPRPPQPLATTTDQTVTNAAEMASSSAIEVLDVSAIEPNNAPKPIDAINDPEVVLFHTPDQPSWLNNSAHQRTYTRVPRLRKKKINIYLANLGLDDDDEEDTSDNGQEYSSDSEKDEATKGKQKKKQGQKRKQGHKRQPVPVEQQTKEFKEFVQNFNSMCNDIDRYEMVIE